jgi:two-component system sensor histidine kinase QseC
MKSLQSRLMVLISLSTILIFAVAVWFGYQKGRHEVEEFLDGQLMLSTRLLDAQMSHSIGALKNNTVLQNGVQPYRDLIEILAKDDRGPYEPELAFKIWDVSGQLLLQSSNAKEMPRLSQGPGQEAYFDGRLWRIASKKTNGQSLYIQTAHPLDTRHSVGLDVALNVMSPLLLGLPFLLALVYFSIGNATKPIRLLSENIKNKKIGDTTLIPMDQVLNELQPLINSFNILLNRLNRTFASERQFTANAAHELRSPIAGIKIQAQLAFSSRDPAIKEKAIGQVVMGVRRSEKLIEQMLRLARLDPDHPDNLNMDSTNVAVLVREAIRLEQSSAEEKNQRLVFYDCPDTISVVCDRELILVAVANLLGNAVKYSPQHSEILIKILLFKESIEISVSDQGPGVPESELVHITKRFSRGMNAYPNEGSGLGLAIVERIVHIHHATLEIKNLVPNGLFVGISLKRL